MPAESRLNTARLYLARGWQPPPIPAGSKAPTIPDWPSFRVNGNAAEFFSAPGNIGILLGEASGGLVDIDIDSPGATSLAPLFLHATGAIFGRPSKPRSHYLYIAQPEPGTARFSDVDGTCLIELRSSGAQTIFPVSTHPSGETVEWHRDGEPARIEPADLLRNVRHLAAATLLVRHYPAEGSRHEFALAFSGALVREGWKAEKIADFMRAVADAAEDPETCDRARTGEYSVQRVAHGRPATGWPRLEKLLRRDVARRLWEWLSSESQRPPSLSVSPLANEIRRIALAEKVALFDKRRDIARLIQNELQAEGDFFRTSDSRGFFFHHGERRIYDVETLSFERLLASISGLSLTESFFKFALDLIRTHTFRDSRTTEVHTLAFFNPEQRLMAVSDGGAGVWVRQPGADWQKLRNGDDGLFFLLDDDATPWTPEFDDVAAHRWWLNQFLFADYGIAVEDSKTLVYVWFAQQFFPALRRTRLVPCFLGPQGSGKSSAVRLIGRLPESNWGRVVDPSKMIATMDDASARHALNQLCISSIPPIRRTLRTARSF